MIMLIQRICMALRGLGSPSSVEIVIRERAAMLLQMKGKRRTDCLHVTVRATHLRAELETDKVSYVVVDHFALLNGCPVPDTHIHTVKQHPPHANQDGTHMMVVKLSLVRIMSAASLHTSVPTFPIAMPMSALFRATASLVPSPVMATTLPTCCKA